MIGLTFARRILNITAIELGKTFNVTRQNICIWESGENNIPEKYSEQLSDLFKLPIELLRKEVTNEEKSYILNRYSELFKKDVKGVE